MQYSNTLVLRMTPHELTLGYRTCLVNKHAKCLGKTFVASL